MAIVHCIDHAPFTSPCLPNHIHMRWQQAAPPRLRGEQPAECSVPGNPETVGDGQDLRGFMDQDGRSDTERAEKGCGDEHREQEH